MWHIASQVTELKKLTLINKDILMALRSNYDKPEQMKELFRRLQSKCILSSYTFYDTDTFLFFNSSWILFFSFNAWVFAQRFMLFNIFKITE